MKRTRIHAAVATALLAPAAVFLAPAPALAQSFNAVDTIPWPTTGRFPAYPPEPRRPTEVWAQAGLLHDNNIFRLSKDANTRSLLGSDTRSDTVARFGAGIRHEQLIAGRQRVRLEARGDQYEYNQNSLLNHFEYGLRGEWLWELTNDLSGAVGVERRQRLIDLAQQQSPVKDLITEDHAFVNGAYRLGPTIQLRSSLDGVRAKHDNAARDTGQLHSTTVTGGVDYVTPLNNSIGLEARRTNGTAPTADLVNSTVFVQNNFHENEVAAVARITASAQLAATGRLGRTTRHNEQFSGQDFKGTTWRASADWTPLQKTGFEFALYKEPRSIIDIAASYIVANGASFGPRWAPSEKVVLSALFLRERQQYVGGIAPAGTPQRDETVRSMRLGVGWEPKRFIELTAGFEHGVRTSNIALRDYDYDAFMANARFRF
jgi:exopolysaccharide biosynthesis operon protein EpsL